MPPETHEVRPKARFFLTETDMYDGPEPFFYDASQFEWVRILEDNWTVVRDEMQAVIDGREAITLSSSNPPYLSNPNAWKNIYFFNFLWQDHKNCKRFPKTYALLKSVPNLTFAEFTVLEPHSRVLPHIGETNTSIRGHLGIVIPGQLPDAGIQVGDEMRSWQVGRTVLFSDCHRHTVWNDTDGRRFVLVFDVIRQEFAHQKYWMCAQSLSALTIKWFDSRFDLLHRLPPVVIHAVHLCLSAIWRIYLPMQNKWHLP